LKKVKDFFSPINSFPSHLQASVVIIVVHTFKVRHRNPYLIRLPYRLYGPRRVRCAKYKNERSIRSDTTHCTRPNLRGNA